MRTISFAARGIRRRRIAGPEESSGDMAVKAAENLFRESPIDRKDVDVLIFCSQSADYDIPATGCILQRPGCNSRTPAPRLI